MSYGSCRRIPAISSIFTGGDPPGVAKSAAAACPTNKAPAVTHQATNLIRSLLPGHNIVCSVHEQRAGGVVCRRAGADGVPDLRHDAVPVAAASAIGGQSRKRSADRRCSSNTRESKPWRSHRSPGNQPRRSCWSTWPGSSGSISSASPTSPTRISWSASAPADTAARRSRHVHRSAHPGDHAGDLRLPARPGHRRPAVHGQGHPCAVRAGPAHGARGAGRQRRARPSFRATTA